MDYTPFTLLTDVGWISLLHVIGNFLRRTVPLFRTLLLPSPITAGILGLILGPQVLDLIGFSDQMGAYTTLLIAVVFAVLYYVMFRFAIVRWNLRIPGRVPDEEFEAAEVTDTTESGDTDASGAGTDGAASSARAEKLITAFGGRDNLIHVDACMTRLRMEVSDRAAVDKARLHALGAAGVMEVGDNVQAVFGTTSEALKDEIRAALAGAAPASTSDSDSAPVVPAPPSQDAASSDSAAQATEAAAGPVLVRSPIPGRTVALTEVPDKTFAAGTEGPGLAI